MGVSILGLTVTFAGRQVLSGIDLELSTGTMTVVIGPSGSGKTTLLRAINRLNECFAGCRTTGQVQLMFRDGMVEAYGPKTNVEELRRRAAMVFQTPNVLPMSVERNMILPVRLALGLSVDQARQRMETALNNVGLLDELQGEFARSALDLSGGQQQRLCLARALALDPEILLLDEPTASVDYRSARRIEELLVRLKSRYTLVVVSHSLTQARRLADRVVLVRDGAVAGTWDKAVLDGSSLESLVEESF